jgi:hypothetical protein
VKISFAEIGFTKKVIDKNMNTNSFNPFPNMISSFLE